MNILKHAQVLTNFAKVFSITIALGVNLYNLVINKTVLSFEQQKSLLLLCSFIVVIFSPVDISLICQNIFKKNMGDDK